MTVKLIEELCTICSQCIVVCPEDAIKGWEFPIIDYDKCTDCKRCIIFCPTGAMVDVEEEKEVQHG